MFDFFKTKPADIKGMRSGLLQFIKEQLQKAEGGEGRNIRGITLYLTCTNEERHLYEAAVYADEEARFKEEEVQKIADDYAIALPSAWTFDIVFTKEAPEEAIKAQALDAALFISTKSKTAAYRPTTATVNVLQGETDKQSYIIAPENERTNIGREKETQAADGFFRKNDIAFVGDNESNRSVSRQHAHIEWNSAAAGYYLFADEGGIPPYNKLKVKTADGDVVKLQTIEFGHCLKDGDQIVLGDAAVLEIRLIAE